MLDGRDRKRLAPLLARERAAETELAASRRALETAKADLDAATTGAGWRDRRLGGLFSQNGDVVRRLREARRDHKRLTRLVDEQQASAEVAAEALDRELAPVLDRRDRGFAQLSRALADCDDALRECRAAADLLTVASGSARTVLKAMSSGPPAAAATMSATEVAATRYEDAVGRAREAVPQLQKVVGKAHRAVVQVTRTSVRLPPNPNPVLVKRVPAGAFTVAERVRLRDAERPLGELRGQIATVTGAVDKWRRVIDSARHRRLRDARSEL